MTLTIDNVVHQNTGGTATSSTSTAIAAALVGGDTTAADSVVIVALFGESLAFTTPAGWALIGSTGGLLVYRRGPVEGLAAGESSWNFTPSATAGKAVVWQVLELSEIDPSLTINAVEASPTILTGGQTYKSSIGPIPSVYDGLMLAFFAIRDSASTTIHTWRGFCRTYDQPGDLFISPWTELAQVGQAGTGNAVNLGCAMWSMTTSNVTGCTGVSATTFAATRPATSFEFVLRQVGAKTVTDLLALDGAEHGTITGNAIGSATSRPLTSATAGVTVDAAAARSGSYGWKLTSSAAACNTLSISYTAASAGSAPTFRRAFRFPTLPGSDLIFWSVLTLNTTQAVMSVRYISATGKVGVVIGTGTEQVSDVAIVADQWFGLDIKFDWSTASTDSGSWTFDVNAELTDTMPGVAQPAVTGSSNTTSITFQERIGWTAAATATMYADDGAMAPGYNYPIGDLRVLPLKVDPAGTPTTSGATTDFGVMTANGTVAAWNATNARNAVDDIPPDLTGTRDAAVCLIANASTYAEFPMESYDLAANRVNVRGARFVGPVWAASTTAATIRVNAYNGTDELPVFAEAGPTGYGNTTPPAWIARMIRPATGAAQWDQAKVDALTIRMGSNDATPDIGLDCILVELGVVKALPESLFGEAGAPIYVEAERDPVTLALVGAVVTNNSGDPIMLAWQVDDVPADSGSIADGTSNQYVPLSPDGGLGTVNTVSLIPG